MLGTFINVIAIITGGLLGLTLGARLSTHVKETITASLGIFTLGLGLQLFFATQNALIVLGSLLIGALLGEWWHIETWLENAGTALEKRFNAQGDSNRFIKGFLTASLLFAIGPMAILGAIQDGLSGDYTLLAVKSVMDGFAALAFAASLGSGVLFSALVILLYQGSLSLMAAQLSGLLSAPMELEMRAAGGIILLGLAISNLLELKKIRVGNLLPALLIAPLIVYLLDKVHIPYY